MKKIVEENGTERTTKENIVVSLLHDADHMAYTSFLQQSPEALYGHSLPVMRLIERHFKFEPCYLVAKEKVASLERPSRIVGVLPLFRAKSILEGTRYISLPFFPFGGVVGTNTVVKKALVEKAKELSRDGLFLELRQEHFLEEEVVQELGLVKQAPITDFLVDLKPSAEEMFASFSKDVRYDIRKAQRNNLHVAIGKEKKRLDDFYRVYLNTRKKRGVPAWPSPLFAEALETCDTSVAVTYLGEKPIAAAFLFFDRKTVEYAFAGTDYRYNSISPYYLLLWEIICYGIAHNYALLDLGGSTKEMNHGNMFAFKEKWATRVREIPYYFYAADEKNIPSLDRSFGVYRLYGKVWSLLPKPVIEKISPFIIRQFK